MNKKPDPTDDEKIASAASMFDGQFASTVKDSAQQIWLAGLGAFAKAQEEGSKVFEALVKEGTSIQRKTQAAAEEKLGDVGAKAGQQWDKLESIFEDRTARALSKLGVPSAKEVEALSQRVDALAAEVAKLSRRSATRAATPKSAVKRSPRKAAT